MHCNNVLKKLIINQVLYTYFTKHENNWNKISIKYALEKSANDLLKLFRISKRIKIILDIYFLSYIVVLN